LSWNRWEESSFSTSSLPEVQLEAIPLSDISFNSCLLRTLRFGFARPTSCRPCSINLHTITSIQFHVHLIYN
jgi:hypothetical protein